MVFTGIIAVSWLAGCQSLGQRDMGRLVPDFYRVAIPPSGETSSNTLKTHDMTVRYQCRRAGNYLKIWGSGDIRYQTINELVFHLYFLDERGEVIGIHNFYSYLDHSDFIDSPSKNVKSTVILPFPQARWRLQLVTTGKPVACQVKTPYRFRITRSTKQKDAMVFQGAI